MSLERELRKQGLVIERFTPYHIRVNGEFDVWFNAEGRSLTWWDRIADERGRKPEDQMLGFICRRLADRKARLGIPKAEFVKRLTGIGWLESEAEAEWTKRQNELKGSGSAPCGETADAR